MCNFVQHVKHILCNTFLIDFCAIISAIFCRIRAISAMLAILILYCTVLHILLNIVNNIGTSRFRTLTIPPQRMSERGSESSSFRLQTRVQSRNVTVGVTDGASDSSPSIRASHHDPSQVRVKSGRPRLLWAWRWGRKFNLSFSVRGDIVWVLRRGNMSIYGSRVCIVWLKFESNPRLRAGAQGRRRRTGRDGSGPGAGSERAPAITNKIVEWQARMSWNVPHIHKTKFIV